MIIGVDIDDVILKVNEQMQAWHNREYNTNFRFEDITEYDLWNVWKCSREEAIKRVMTFFLSSHI